jgi:hypothetical protein
VWGIVARVRVAEVVKGPKKVCINLFYGKMKSLGWDPNKFRWNASTPFMRFSTKLGRELLKARHDIPNVAVRKWHGILPADHNFK